MLAELVAETQLKSVDGAKNQSRSISGMKASRAPMIGVKDDDGLVCTAGALELLQDLAQFEIGVVDLRIC
jgi:hypothetical protein